MKCYIFWKWRRRPFWKWGFSGVSLHFWEVHSSFSFKMVKFVKSIQKKVGKEWSRSWQLWSYYEHCSITTKVADLSFQHNIFLLSCLLMAFDFPVNVSLWPCSAFSQWSSAASNNDFLLAPFFLQLLIKSAFLFLCRNSLAQGNHIDGTKFAKKDFNLTNFNNKWTHIKFITYLQCMYKTKYDAPHLWAYHAS